MHTIVVLCATIVGMFGIIVSKKIYASLFNPITIFNIGWIISINMSNLNLYDINKPDIIIYLMVLFMIISFFIGNLVALNCRRVEVSCFNHININKKVLIVFNVIGIIVLLPFTIKAINIIASNGLSHLRGVLGSKDGLGLTSNIQWIIMSWIIAPIFNATMIIAIVSAFFYKLDKKLIVLTIINIFLYTLTFGGRWFILRTIIIIIFSILLTKNNSDLINKIKKVRKKFILLLIIGSVSLIIITSQRSMGGSEIKTMYLYFFAPMSYFNEYLKMGIESPYLLGGAFIAGLQDVPIIIFSILTGISFERPAEIVGKFTSPTVDIGGGVLFNGFGSSLMDFWIDFGISGAIINGLILGFIVGLIYKSYALNPRSKNISIYIFTLLLLSLTPIKWELDLQWSWFTYIFIIIFTYEKKKRYL